MGVGDGWMVERAAVAVNETLGPGTRRCCGFAHRHLVLFRGDATTVSSDFGSLIDQIRAVVPCCVVCSRCTVLC